MANLSMRSSFLCRFVMVAAATAAAACTLLLSPAPASAAGKRVGVPKFDGPQEALVRKRVMQVLKSEGYELVKSRDIENAVQSTGQSLDSNDGYRAIAKELALSAFVTGEVSKKKAKITVRNGSDGTVSGEGSFAGANPRKVAAEVGKSFWRRLGSAVDRGSVPAGAKKPKASSGSDAPEDNEDAPEAAGAGGDDDSDEKAAAAKSEAKPEPDATASNEEGSEDDRPRKKRRKPVAETTTSDDGDDGGAPSGLAWLDASVGPRGFTRDFVYHQDINLALRQYKLSVGPAAAAAIAFYPAGLSGGGFAANIGIEIGVEQAFGITSKVNQTANFPNGATFPTTIHDFSVGLRYRLPIDANEVIFSVSGGEHAFAFRSDGSADRGLLDIPDTIYRYVRPGVGARIALPSGLSLMVGAGYRYVFNGGGQIKDTFFPHLTVAGVDANLALGYRVTPIIEARVIGDLRRYFYNMHSVQADDRVAGGAVDQYLSLTLAIAFRLGDEPHDGGGSASSSQETALNE